MPDDQTLAEFELYTPMDIQLSDNHQRAIKYCCRDIIKRMRCFMWRPAYAEHLIFATWWGFVSNRQPKLLYSEICTADQWWRSQDRRDTKESSCAIRCHVSPQIDGYTTSLNLHVHQRTSLKFCLRQTRVRFIYVNWQSILETSARCPQLTAL